MGMERLRGGEGRITDLVAHIREFVTVFGVVDFIRRGTQNRYVYFVHFVCFVGS